ncbi:MAG TPA: L-erythro-3,5-diaminohexanoate dehydrogenase [Thermotogota bacterium]|nr:L-erythro-3,5-diaminohexanoate dehydrogenase [Thermotogota bacterium]HRW91690.1 L-erythro-3,5-diaminohexanoate dehydrogenase [Thermotogota bacterium]
MSTCPFGSHRVIDPKGSLPQPAWKLDNNMDHDYENEIIIDVTRLNIDSASFRQIKEEVGSEEEKVAAKILQVVQERGKMHNPVTGSGGMLVGTVARISKNMAQKHGVRVGDKVASLVSLSLTPLKIDRILKVHLDREQVEVEAKAVLFESGVLAKLPATMSEPLALSILDVAGAPIQTARLVRPGDTVMVMGAAGKSGLLCSTVARQTIGNVGKLIGLIHHNNKREEVEKTGLFDAILQVDATDAVGVYHMIHDATDGELCDVTINVVNAPNTEMACILSTKHRGKVYFFSMATSFTKAALGAEGVGKDVDMIVGNGYAKDHARYALDVVANNPGLLKVFEKRYGE